MKAAPPKHPQLGPWLLKDRDMETKFLDTPKVELETEPLVPASPMLSYPSEWYPDATHKHWEL